MRRANGWAGGRDTSMRIGIEFELMRRVHTEAQRGDAEEVVARAYQARGRGAGAPPTQKCRRVAVCRTHSGTMTREPSRQRLNDRDNIQSSSTASLAVVMCSLFQLRSRGPTLAMGLGVPAPSRNMPLAISSSDTTFTCDRMGRRQDIMGEVSGGSFCLDGRNLTLRSSAR